jgi:transcription initiation factor TFIIB
MAADETLAEPDAADPKSDPQTSETLTCPECGGHVAMEGTEQVCVECGLVVHEDEIDRGPGVAGL